MDDSEVPTQKMAHFNRERVLERVVHAKGGGAHGFFEANGEGAQWCSAPFLADGVRTEVFARFSTVAGESGSADTVRGLRGFALKFYTDQGNYDLVGSNTPVFFIRDPQKFADFIHSQKRRPDTHTRDNNMQWDFWTLSPESAHQVTWLMGDRGTPRTWRHMNGYSGHTYMWTNAGGERYWVKYHFQTDQGIENFTDADARAMVAEDPDYHLRDLFQAIDRGDPPSWSLQMQIMPFDEAADYRFNPFDLTKVWPHFDYPLFPVGRLVLDRNPANYFLEVEQAAFEPGNLVPGVGPSPDKMLLGRLFSYYASHSEVDDFGQAGDLYRSVLDEGARSRLASNVGVHLSNGVSGDVLHRAIRYWHSVDPDLGARVAKVMALDDDTEAR